MTQKITLSSSRDIPLNKLVLSQSNVRRIKSGISVEELAEDIARRGLLQSLNVRPVLNAGGAETGMFEVPAGGRRFQALQLLVKQKRLAKNAPVPCVVRDAVTDIMAEDDSLAENVQRVPLHPLDQFRAFKTLRDKGMSEEDIAAAFFVGVSVVKQRLRLAAVSEKLLETFADDGMALDQLMAFTVTDDHARQEQVWDAVKDSWNNTPFEVRKMLTERTVRASDRRALFVGVEAYEQAGGTVIRDLFTEDHGGWLENVALLDGLVTEKLTAEAGKIAGEGWKWIEVNIDFPFGHTNHLRQLDGTPVDVTAEEQATIEALTAEHDRLEQEYADADELPDEVDARLGEIETALLALEDRPLKFNPAEIARAGVFVSITRDGALSVDRGYVRPEDEPPSGIEPDSHRAHEPGESGTGEPGSPAVQRAVITIGGQPETGDDEDDAIKPLPDRLVSELTAYRTLALRNAVGGNPHVAMTALLHKLCIDTFHHGLSNSCLEASVREVSFPIQPTDLKDSLPAKAVDERHEAWSTDVPKDEAALWDWLDTLDDARRANLLAHCVSFGVNALHEKADRYGAGGISAHGVQRRLAQADRLARAVGLDLVQCGWRPTAENYLGRVTKPRILAAVREAKGEPAAQLIDHLKKAEMAKEAERLLEDTGWLPGPLRTPDEMEAATGAEALPAFLSGDDEEAEEEDAEDPEALAAE
jgi:ParB family transcriptional regulator, chromosome partitioning protein